jgi:predicted DNA-binding transcriptional regulator
LEQNFPSSHYPESKTTAFRRCKVARLFKGEKAHKETRIQRLLHQHDFGLRESEIAQELGWERRTVNNYLRDLKRRGRVYKEGRCWLVDE